MVEHSEHYEAYHTDDVQVALIMEILHQFSHYLEVVVLVPQFVLMYRREKYESWVMVYTFCAGAESVVRHLPTMLDWRAEKLDNPYGE